MKSIYNRISISIYLSINLYIYLYIRLSIYLFTYLYRVSVLTYNIFAVLSSFNIAKFVGFPNLASSYIYYSIIISQ